MTQGTQTSALRYPKAPNVDRVSLPGVGAARRFGASRAQWHEAPDAIGSERPIGELPVEVRAQDVGVGADPGESCPGKHEG